MVPSSRLAGMVDAAGHYCLDRNAAGQAEAGLGPRPRLPDMQQLYSPNTAALLVPAYLGRQEGDAADVNLKDKRQTIVTLTDEEGMKWRAELLVLCLAIHDDFRALWRR